MIMFSRMQLLSEQATIKKRFHVAWSEHHFTPDKEINGFSHNAHPVITNTNPTVVSDGFRWGLVPPDWNKNPEAIWNHTISAKLEYLEKRYSWQKVVQNRCLVPRTAYFEFHWNDPVGKSKTKYMIKSKDDAIFALAGLYSIWKSPDSTLLKTFAVCTTQANEIMEFVHNKDASKNYHRMPVMLNQIDERNWLDESIPHMEFAYPSYRPDLVAAPIVGGTGTQINLF